MHYRRLLAGATAGALGWVGIVAAVQTAPVHAAPAHTAQERRASRAGHHVELIIPKLGLDDPVREGVSESDLWQGVGHYPGTGQPGRPGNGVYLGHRTAGAAPFKDLERMRAGDVVVLAAGGDRYTYKVVETRVTSPFDPRVLAPDPMRPGRRTDGSWTTLVTCHPRGSDRQRFVVFARLTHQWAKHRVPRSVSRVISDQKRHGSGFTRAITNRGRMPIRPVGKGTSCLPIEGPHSRSRARSLSAVRRAPCWLQPDQRPRR
ncbi:class E sortase [Actinomadura rupiterrae]|uniref:class E sortase n=1 Tax=Actinomadura rupiterrae TaxID=559627 RepID=UPI003557D782